MQSPLICSLICALCANLIAEVMLAHSLQQPWARLSATQRHMRQLRWVLCSAGCLVLGIQQVLIGQQIVFGLFSVSAATDFETKLLPPDWYLYGSVIIGIAIYGVVNGWGAASHSHSGLLLWGGHFGCGILQSMRQRRYQTRHAVWLCLWLAGSCVASRNGGVGYRRAGDSGGCSGTC